MKINAQQFRDYLDSIQEIITPNTGVVINTSDIFPDINNVAMLTIAFLESSDNDRDLQTLHDNFCSSMQAIFDGDLNRYSESTGNLAITFEPFLKKIGYFLYKGTPYYDGDSTHQGLKETALGGLIQGSLAPKRTAPLGTRGRSLPTSLVTNSSTSRELLEFLRILRNDVHLAKKIDPGKVVHYAQYVLFNYLLAIQLHQEALAIKLLPADKYRAKLKDHYAKWERQYFSVSLLEREATDMIGISPTVVETDWDNTVNDAPFIAKQGKIIDITRQVKMLMLVGEPGLGKTTTLYYLGHFLAKQACHLPLYFPLKDFLSRKSILNQVAEYAGLPLESINEYSQKALITFLFDGTNEVLVKEEAIDLKNQLKSLMRQFPESNFVITSRPNSFRNDYQLPVFELQPLTNAEIDAFIQQNYPVEGTAIVSTLNAQTRIREICRNPLILVMLCSLAKHSSIIIPDNKGLILRTFIDNILKREEDKNSLFDSYRHFRYLVAIGTFARIGEKITFNQNDALQWIGAASETLEPNVSRLTILSSLIGTGILMNRNGHLSFVHELYQEYFAAEGIDLGIVDAEKLAVVRQDSHWEQPIILYSGLINNAKEFIEELAHENPLLAVKCAESLVHADDQLLNSLIAILKDNVKKIEEMELASSSFQGLLRLGQSRIVRDTLKEITSLHGQFAYRFLGQISAILIKGIELPYLVDSIKLVVNIGPHFLKSIVRTLEKRNSEELTDFRNEIFDALIEKLKKEQNLPYIYRLIKVLSYDKIEQVGIDFLKSFCVALCKLDYSSVLRTKNVLLRVIEQFNLLKKPELIEDILHNLIVSQHPNHTFIHQLYQSTDVNRKWIVETCLTSNNTASICTGIYLAAKNHSGEDYDELIKNIPLARDSYIKKQLQGIKHPKQFSNVIGAIFLHQSNLNTLINIALSETKKNIKYGITSNTDQYIGLKVKGIRMGGRLLKSELKQIPETNIRHISARLIAIDWVNQIPYFTQMDVPVENYKSIIEYPEIGIKVNAWVFRMEKNRVLLKFKLHHPAVLEIENGVKYSLNQTIKIRITGLDKGLYHANSVAVPLKFKSKKVKKFPKNPKIISSKKFTKNVQPSEFGEQLEEALKRGR
jgi:hypothetical protein